MENQGGKEGVGSVKTKEGAQGWKNGKKRAGIPAGPRAADGAQARSRSKGEGRLSRWAKG